jgi:hypothetical protein
VTNPYQQSAQRIWATIDANDYSGAIAAAESLLPSAPNASEKGRLMNTLALAYLMRRSGTDLSTGIDLCKQIYSDETLPPEARAFALNTLASIVYNLSPSDYQANLGEQPFAEMLPSSGSDKSRISEAYFNILTLSEKTYPTSYAAYALAGNYYAPKLVNTTLGTSTADEIAHTMQDLIAAGDTIQDGSQYSTSGNLIRYMYRALGVAASGRILGAPLSDREAGFRIALALSQRATMQLPESALIEPVDLRIRFLYANFLVVDTTGREADIRQLLAPFASASTTTPEITAFFSGIKHASPPSYLTRNAQKLIGISSDFARFYAAL